MILKKENMFSSWLIAIVVSQLGAHNTHQTE